jgi:HAD superfamily hydrolase (TIGR01484 family)
MQPIDRCPSHELARIRGVLFDLDDTVLTHGVLTRDAYDAVWDLRDAGYVLVAVTGRPSAWGEIAARQWPVDGCVTENGAVTAVRDGHHVRTFERCTIEERRRRQARLAGLVELLKAEFPMLGVTDDVAGRRSDVTWDIGERVTIERPIVLRAAALLRSQGAKVTASSVHLHATFDTDDKASGVISFLASLGHDPGLVPHRFAFIGDSGNDAACFASFKTTFGVANVVTQVASLPILPKYVTRATMGAGFAEFARTLLAHRTA